jgi:glycosyltransferase involved in cell wall biosynthesis
VLDRITPIVLTRDEEPNIARTLAQLAWASEVVVVDSYSRDSTVRIASSFPNVRILQREIDSIAGQSNYGVAHARAPWVLLLDADYFVPEDLVGELKRLEPAKEVRGYRGRFRYAIDGRPLRASLYPPRIVMFDRASVRIWQDGHTPRIAVDGNVSDLWTPIIHDDRKSFAAFIQRQHRYMRQEADKLVSARSASLNLPARIRKWVVVAPLAVLVHTLFVKGLILDGTAGLRYAWERFLAEIILSQELMYRLVGRNRRQPPTE